MDLNLYKSLEGDFVTLNEITVNDAEIIYEWRTGQSGKYMNQPVGYSLNYQKRWIESRPDNEINYIISSKKSGKKVGMIAVVGISEQNKNAEVGRLLLAPEYLNKSNPYGLEALKICYNLIINEWNFNKVFGNVLSANTAMLKLQKFLGMTEEGKLKEQTVINNQFYDLFLVAIFRDQLNKLYIPRINLLLKSFR